jgi:flagellar motor switch protein FliN/FliY
VLRLGPGSVLELDKASGEPLDLYVNNRLIARGEAVVIGERYGIRLTEVVMNDEARKGEGG